LTTGPSTDAESAQQGLPTTQPNQPGVRFHGLSKLKARQPGVPQQSAEQAPTEPVAALDDTPAKYVPCLTEPGASW